MNFINKNITKDEKRFAYSLSMIVFKLKMKSTTVRSILDELPPDVRDILTQHAVHEEEDINTLIKKWITSAAERLTLPQPTEKSPAGHEDNAA